MLEMAWGEGSGLVSCSSPCGLTGFPSFLISGEGAEGQGEIAGREGLTSVEINKTQGVGEGMCPGPSLFFIPRVTCDLPLSENVLPRSLWT